MVDGTRRAEVMRVRGRVFVLVNQKCRLYKSSMCSLALPSIDQKTRGRRRRVYSEKRIVVVDENHKPKSVQIQCAVALESVVSG